MQLDDLPRLTDEERAALDDCAAIAGVPTGAPPLRRCSDCRLDLGDLMLALGRCPLFGQRRLNVERRCASFTPKIASFAAAPLAGDASMPFWVQAMLLVLTVVLVLLLRYSWKLGKAERAKAAALAESAAAGDNALDQNEWNAYQQHGEPPAVASKPVSRNRHPARNAMSRSKKRHLAPHSSASN